MPTYLELELLGLNWPYIRNEAPINEVPLFAAPQRVSSPLPLNSQAREGEGEPCDSTAPEPIVCPPQIQKNSAGIRGFGPP